MRSFKIERGNKAKGPLMFLQKQASFLLWLKINHQSSQDYCFRSLTIHLPEGLRPDAASGARQKVVTKEKNPEDAGRKKENSVNWSFERTWRTFVFALLLRQRVQLPAQRLFPLLSICAAGGRKRKRNKQIKKTKEQQANKSPETIGVHIRRILSGLSYLISLCQECRRTLSARGKPSMTLKPYNLNIRQGRSWY